jgi:hypothetical protein
MLALLRIMVVRIFGLNYFLVASRFYRATAPGDTGGERRTVLEQTRAAG